jgi:3-phenylpropionate/trans-cinnamate dioxygenase ferredoxin component
MEGQPGLTRVMAAGDIAPGTGCVVDIAGKVLAIFRVDRDYYAIDNTCPHRGGPLGEGDIVGPVVACPWHGWSWDVTTGANVNNPAVRLACYPVTVRDGAVYVRFAP